MRFTVAAGEPDAIIGCIVWTFEDTRCVAVSWSETRSTKKVPKLPLGE